MKNIFNCLLVGETGTEKNSFGNFALGIENAFEVQRKLNHVQKILLGKLVKLILK